MELFRLLLDPLQARLLAEHPDALAMKVARRGHADPHQSAGAVREAQFHVRIVVRLAPGDHRRELRRDLRHLETGVAELAGADHLPRLPHHRIAGVVVGDGEHQAGPTREAQEIEGVVEPGGERRVADVRARPAADHAKAELAPSLPNHTRTPNSAISFCISRPPAIMSSTWSRAISVFRKVPIERPRLRSVKESPTG